MTQNVNDPWYRGREAKERKKAAEERLKRKCLRCEKEFSAISKYNRICRSCNDFITSNKIEID